MGGPTVKFIAAVAAFAAIAPACHAGDYAQLKQQFCANADSLSPLYGTFCPDNDAKALFSPRFSPEQLRREGAEAIKASVTAAPTAEQLAAAKKMLARELEPPEREQLSSTSQAALLAPEHRMIIPPAEYDHPYEGDLWILRANSEQMARLCPPPKNPRNYITGCAKIMMNGCWVVIADESILRKTGLSYRVVLRHEQGHCNNWPANHLGARLATDQDW
jgi:hypothetical protein